ncbi:Gfo/Idh/MocA family protein [Jiangella muralis]|uniref:Gfo/Idh/MocA family protein n=1 Tax=Jiangella muralis TaxID=702383 RepID=UPI00069D71D7|nr:Gfo/Idh/MocA family oxidoreductase [Jiangella muralis]
MSVPVAVIGAGRFGTEHLRAFARLPRARVTAVVDPDLSRATAAAREFGAVPFPDVASLLATGPPAAASVAVPAAHRGTIVPDLVAAGVGVLVEKPIATGRRDAEALERATPGRPVLVGHLLRFAAPYLRMRRLAEQGALGELRASRTRASRHLDDFPGESLVRLTMIHDLDLVSWFVDDGAITGVRATATWRPDGRITSCRAEIDVADGPAVMVSGDWAGGAHDEEDVLVIRGATTTATMRLGARDGEIRSGGQTERLPGAAEVYAEALADELAHFLDCVERGTPSARLRVHDAVTAVALADAVERSLQEGGRHVPLG